MRTSTVLMLALLAAACDGKGGDADDDGYSADEDCDDENDLVHPGATEICDGIDNNCDGSVDEGLSKDWYRDADGDSYGDPDAVQTDCAQPDGYVADNGDCNDASVDFHPGATEDDCTDPNDYNCDGSVGYADLDGDGAPACEDCDDTDAARFEGNPEVCDDIDNDCNNVVDDDAVDATDWYIDYDGDGWGSDNETYVVSACAQPAGYVDVSGDCDDLHATANPDGVEVCDGVDNDCDGDYDEGSDDLQIFYADEDGDGQGDPENAVTACEAPSGYVSNYTDCDDSNADVNLLADEVCDGVDNDCDGLVDDEDSDVVTSSGSYFYGDDDGDGYGVGLDVTFACSEPEGYVDNPDDCDDSDADVNPAATETCDSIDNNCDGEIDEDTASDAGTWYLDLDEDDYGEGDTTTVSCLQPDGYTDNGDDCDDEDPDVNPGVDEVCNDGIDNNCDGGFASCTLELSDADIVFRGGSSSDEAGIGLSNAGDIDADGYDELLIGARSADDSDTDAGTTYLYWGSELAAASGTLDLDDAVTDNLIITGETNNDKSGKSVTGNGDLDGDGTPDVVVAAANASDAGTARGATYVIYGSGISGMTGELSLADADVRFNGVNNYDYAGGVVKFIGSVNSTSYDTLLIGVTGDDSGAANAGGVYLITGPITSTTDIKLSTTSDKLYGETASQGLGNAFDGGFDFDGDGTGDVLIGSVKDSTNGSSAGCAYLVTGPATGWQSLGGADMKLLGDSGDQVGSSVAGAGDQDGDGYADFLVNAPYDDTVGSNAGVVFLVNGTTSVSSLDGMDLWDVATVVVYGSSSFDGTAASVDGTGDLDGDDTNDILLGVTSVDSSSGASFLLFGPLTGSVDIDDADARFDGVAANDGSGNPVAWGGDYDGGGNNSILISAQANDSGGTDAGAVYLIRSIDE